MVELRERRRLASPHWTQEFDKGKETFPFVQVAYAEAEAYANWAHKQSNGSRHSARSRGAFQKREGSSGRIVSVHRSVLLTVHGGYARQGGSQHRHESSRVSLRDPIVLSISGRSYRYRLEGIRAKTAQPRRGWRIERLKLCCRPSNALHVIHKRTVPALPFAGPIWSRSGGATQNPSNPARRAEELHYSRASEQTCAELSPIIVN
jgi:hypothetical protein